YRWNAFNSTFHRSRHRTRVDHINRVIEAMINSGYAEIWFLSFEYLIDRQFHTIHRCTRTFVHLHTFIQFYLIKPQRLAYSYGVAHARLWPIRRHNNNITQRSHHFYKTFDARSRDPVIVHDQYI